MPPTRIIRGLGGNGSTFLARVIAAMDKTVLLSESNPASANLFSFALNPVTQIRSNYRHLDFPDYEGNIAELGAPHLFGKYIDWLTARCAAIDHILVIRDYNYADYIGTPFCFGAARHSSLDVALANSELRDILLIRHPVRQFLSLISHA